MITQIVTINLGRQFGGPLLQKRIKAMFKRYALFENMLTQTHLLVAGCTGSGKSVVVNGLIYTALFYKPVEKQFILIDPKRVELNEYRDLPHTIAYASEPETIYNALQLAMDICENRYKAMQKTGLKLYSGSDVYLIIDEYADLVTTDKKRVKPLIQRLAQIGRAARIHIVLCTQTPIRSILDTDIKCNIDARIGLKTRSKQDSINILGFTGLESLPRYGQGIYLTPTENTLYYIPYIDDAARARMINEWKQAAARVKPHRRGILSRIFK